VPPPAFVGLATPVRPNVLLWLHESRVLPRRQHPLREPCGRPLALRLDLRCRHDLHARLLDVLVHRAGDVQQRLLNDPLRHIGLRQAVVEPAAMLQVRRRLYDILHRAHERVRD